MPSGPGKTCGRPTWVRTRDVGAMMPGKKGGVMGDRVRWSDDADEVIMGDLTAAAAYLTPAGGAVVTAVAPCGMRQRDTGVLEFTTSLGFGKKLQRIVADPHVAL